jgi:fructose-bisphosphate aldolase class II
MDEFTDVAEAADFVEKTGVAALAVLVGTAHGRYKKPPKLDIQRIADIKNAAKIPLVLHGGSGIPDDQIIASIKAGIRKINFGTDICYSFLDGVFAVDRSTVAIDLFMKEPINCVKQFALSKIKLLGAEGMAK